MADKITGPCTETLDDETIPDVTDVLNDDDADYGVEETNAKEGESA